MKYQNQPQDLFFGSKEVLGKHFINLINLSKFLAILDHKQTYKEGHFW